MADIFASTENNKFARGDDGVESNPDKMQNWLQLKDSVFAEKRDTDEYPDPDPADQGTYTKSADDQAAELRKNIAALPNEDKDLIEKAITCILSNKKDDGTARKMAFVATPTGRDSTRMQSHVREESKIIAQGLDASDRNRARWP